MDLMIFVELLCFSVSSSQSQNPRHLIIHTEKLTKNDTYLRCSTMHVFSEGCRHPLFDLCEDNPHLHDRNVTSLADWWCKRCDPRINLQQARIFQRLSQLVPQEASSLADYYAQEAKLVLNAKEVYIVPEYDMTIWDEPPAEDIVEHLAKAAEDLAVNESKAPLFVNYGLSKMISDTTGITEVNFHAGPLPVILKGPISKERRLMINTCTHSRYLTARNIAKMVSEGGSLSKLIFRGNDWQPNPPKSQRATMLSFQQLPFPMEH